MSTALLDRQCLQERQGGVWQYVSASRLNLWLKCPLAFKARYIEGIRTPTTPSLFLGKMTHAALELWYRHRQLGMAVEAAEIITRFDNLWGKAVDEENMKFESVADEQALKRQAGDLVAAYLKYIPPDEPRPMAVETAVESPLIDPATGKDLGTPLVGIMDLVLDDPAGPLVVDFKTSARSAEPLEISHEIQLTSYAYLFRRGTEQQESAMEIRSLIKTKLPKVDFHRYRARTEAHFARLFSVVKEYLDALDTGRFNYRPGFGCGLCDVRDSHCRRWSG
jgi:putative RecB family exonuclease